MQPRCPALHALTSSRGNVLSTTAIPRTRSSHSADTPDPLSVTYAAPTPPAMAVFRSALPHTGFSHQSHSKHHLHSLSSVNIRAIGLGLNFTAWNSVPRRNITSSTHGLPPHNPPPRTVYADFANLCMYRLRPPLCPPDLSPSFLSPQFILHKKSPNHTHTTNLSHSLTSKTSRNIAPQNQTMPKRTDMQASATFMFSMTVISIQTIWQVASHRVKWPQNYHIDSTHTHSLPRLSIIKGKLPQRLLHRNCRWGSPNRLLNSA